MTTSNPLYHFIIIGGSFAGLSAALSLARANRKVLIIDNGNPCNKVVKYSYNFLSHDGQKPSAVISKALAQVLAYPTVTLLNSMAVAAEPTAIGVKVTTEDHQEFHCYKLLFATGISDVMPDIPGFTECWGKTILHCPYCHGYEVKDQRMAVVANAEHAYHLCVLLSNLTDDLTLFTHGPVSLSEEQVTKLRAKKIRIIESPIREVIHIKGKLKKIKLVDGSSHKFNVMFAKILLKQQCALPERLGCDFNEHLIKVDDCQKTSLPNIFAAGDNCRIPRTISLAVAAGTHAAFMMNWELSTDQFAV